MKKSTEEALRKAKDKHVQENSERDALRRLYFEVRPSVVEAESKRLLSIQKQLRPILMDEFEICHVVSPSPCHFDHPGNKIPEKVHTLLVQGKPQTVPKRGIINALIGKTVEVRPEPHKKVVITLNVKNPEPNSLDVSFSFICKSYKQSFGGEGFYAAEIPNDRFEGSDEEECVSKFIETFYGRYVK